MQNRVILIVDDTAEDCEYLEDIILRADPQTSFKNAVNTSGAVEAFQKFRPDCVLLDYQLEAEHGLGVLPALQCIDPTVPVIMLTGQGSEMVAAEAMKAGAADYLSKQIATPTDLNFAINNAIERAKLERRIEEQELQIQQQGRLDSLGQLSAGIAHDFNNTLTSIRFAITAAQKDKLSEKSRQNLNSALVSIDQATSLTENLLGFASKQVGRLSSKTCSKVLEELENLAREPIESSCAIDFQTDDPDELVFCDHAILQSALLNLVLNARDAVQDNVCEGHIIVRTTLIERVNAGPVIEFRVEDDGVGMSYEVLSKATDPFFTTKRDKGGTGLGLGLAYGFAKQSDGNLTIKSRKGFGTTVCLTIPLKMDDDEKESKSKATILSKDPTKTHVLLVEDEVLIRTVLANELQEVGYIVHTEPNANKALASIAHFTPDILITDISMPGDLDGFGLAIEMRVRVPGLNVIGMSGFHNFDSHKRISTIEHMLTKPFDPGDLLEVLNELVD
jgi:signal transduction histidine kinase